MKHRELLEFLTYLPWSLRNKHLKKVESKSDTLYVPGIYKDSHFFRKGVNPCKFLAHTLWAGNLQGFTPFQMDQNLKKCESLYVSSI